MNASLLESDSLAGQVRSLLAAVDQLQAEVVELRRENVELRRENAELRQQVSELRCDVGYWKSRHADAIQRNIKLQAELDQAQAEIRQLKSERFGKQSEKQSSSDRSNQLGDPQATKTAKNKRGQQPGRPAPKRRDRSHLPVREETVDVSDDAKVCGCCGKPMADLGYCDNGEQIEMDTIVYRRVVRRKRYRRTCDCRQQPPTVTAPPPPKLLPKSLYGTSIWVHLLLEKFHLQRPTQRTIEQLRLLGLSLAAGTIADGQRRIEPLLRPIYQAIRAYHLQSDYFHADETRWRVFAEKAGKIGHRWWLWLFAGKGSVVYVRRDFVRVGKGYPELNTWALQWLDRIRELYRLNRERLRQAAETAEFAAIDARLREQVMAMAAQRAAELADEKLREPCRKALVSLREHWSGLTLFVGDPRIPLDNNYGERLIRNPAVGRKNYYGSGAEWAGRLAMMMFSIFATLVLWKINPRTWLAWYLDACAEQGGHPADNPASFLPWNLSESRLAELQSPKRVDAPNTS